MAPTFCLPAPLMMPPIAAWQHKHQEDAVSLYGNNARHLNVTGLTWSLTDMASKMMNRG